LRVTLEKNHSLKVSKYKLWKTLHELGFKYAKINRNKKALVERKDLVNKRFFFYVQLNKNEMKDITLFTWTKLGLIPGSAGTNCSSTHLLNITEFISER
jgi:hypothetical protein